MTENPTKVEGLTLEELQAQVGGLLPDRIEMRRKRRRKRRGSSTVVVSSPSDSATSNTCSDGLSCVLNNPNILNGNDIL